MSFQRRLNTGSDACSTKWGEKNIKTHVVTVKQTITNNTVADYFLVSISGNYKIHKVVAFRVKYFKVIQGSALFATPGAVYFLNSDTLSKLAHSNNAFIVGQATDNVINEAQINSSIIAQTVNVGTDNGASYLTENENPMFLVQDASSSNISIFDFYISSLTTPTFAYPHAIEVSIEFYYLDEDYK